MSGNVNLIARARDYAETLRKRWTGREIEIQLFKDLADALEVSEAAQAKRSNVYPPPANPCPHGFIDWDFCPECCHLFNGPKLCQV